MSEKTLNIAKNAIDTLVQFVVDGIVSSLVNLSVKHIVNSLAAGYGNVLLNGAEVALIAQLLS